MLWDAGNGQILNTIDCHPDMVHSLAFNRDGTRLATTCKDKKIRSIDPRSGLVVSVSIYYFIFRIKKIYTRRLFIMNHSLFQILLKFLKIFFT